MKKLSELPLCNILLFDDHVIFSEGLRILLKQMVPYARVTTVHLAASARLELASTPFRLLVCDVNVRGENLLPFFQKCKREHPEMSILIISTNEDPILIEQCLSTGVQGYISKSTSEIELEAAIDQILSGQRYIDAGLSAKLEIGRGLEKAILTQKEIEILRVMAAGYNVRKIADKMYISPYTVMAHRRNIMKKLQVHSAAELVRFAFDKKLV